MKLDGLLVEMLIVYRVFSAIYDSNDKNPNNFIIIEFFCLSNAYRTLFLLIVMAIMDLLEW